MTPHLSPALARAPSDLLLGSRASAADDLRAATQTRSTPASTDVAIGLAYFALSSATRLLARSGGGVALFFVANAVLLARLWSIPARAWPRPIIIVVGVSLACSLLFSIFPLLLSVGVAAHVVDVAFPMLMLSVAANIIDAVFAAALLRRWNTNGELFETTRSVIVFVLAAGVLGPSLGGAIGATASLTLLHDPWTITWIDWVVGHGLGTLITVPMVILVTSGEFGAWWRALTRRSATETLLLLSVVALVTTGVFTQNRLPLLFLPTLPVLIVTFQLGQVGAAMAVLIVAAIGGACTIHGLGPVLIAKGSKVSQFEFFQFYTATIFLIALPVAGALKQRERLLGALQESEARYRLLADNVSDAILRIAKDGTILYASPSVRDLTGFDPRSLIARNALEMVHPDDVERMRAMHRKALQTPDRNFTIDYRLTTAHGAVEWFESRTKAVKNLTGEVEGVISAVREIGERKQLEEQLREAAETDPLTGLANRRALVHHLNIAILESGKGRAASLAMLDLDFFKRVNDEYGHAAGDTTLMLLADICRQLVRSNDIVARIGGEEFALLLVGADVAEAGRVCDRLRQKIKACEVPVGPERSVTVTASIGVSSVRAGSSSDDILAAADAALYRAKHAGRNCVVVCD